jgi:hypothetical protein
MWHCSARSKLPTASPDTHHRRRQEETKLPRRPKVPIFLSPPSPSTSAKLANAQTYRAGISRGSSASPYSPSAGLTRLYRRVPHFSRSLREVGNSRPSRTQQLNPLVRGGCAQLPVQGGQRDFPAGSNLQVSSVINCKGAGPVLRFPRASIIPTEAVPALPVLQSWAPRTSPCRSLREAGNSRPSRTQQLNSLARGGAPQLPIQSSQRDFPPRSNLQVSSVVNRKPVALGEK